MSCRYSKDNTLQRLCKNPYFCCWKKKGREARWVQRSKLKISEAPFTILSCLVTDLKNYHLKLDLIKAFHGYASYSNFYPCYFRQHCAALHYKISVLVNSNLFLYWLSKYYNQRPKNQIIKFFNCFLLNELKDFLVVSFLATTGNSARPLFLLKSHKREGCSFLNFSLG